MMTGFTGCKGGPGCKGRPNPKTIGGPLRVLPIFSLTLTLTLTLLSGVGWTTPPGEPSPVLPPLEMAPLPLTRDTMLTAIRNATPAIQRGAAGSAKQRTCFTCHHQAMPMLALSEAKALGVEIDELNWLKQLEHTQAHLKRGYRNYLKGKGQGGKVTTAGYLLWALEAAGVDPDDETTGPHTAAAAGYLLQTQKDKGCWSQSSQRPPTSGSDFTNTYLAVRAIQYFGDEEQAGARDEKIAATVEWLATADVKDHEDRVFRLRLMEYVAVDEKMERQAVTALLDAQRFDGGWSQLPTLSSDAYATATAVTALLRRKLHARPSDPLTRRQVVAARRALQWLLQHQLTDGTWRVRTRARGFQTYFETGFPHGKDQFVSMSASCWAVIALALSSSLGDDLGAQ